MGSRRDGGGTTQSLQDAGDTFSTVSPASSRPRPRSAFPSILIYKGAIKDCYAAEPPHIAGVSPAHAPARTHPHHHKTPSTYHSKRVGTAPHRIFLLMSPSKLLQEILILGFLKKSNCRNRFGNATVNHFSKHIAYFTSLSYTS